MLNLVLKDNYLSSAGILRSACLFLLAEVLSCVIRDAYIEKVLKMALVSGFSFLLQKQSLLVVVLRQI